MTGSDRPNDRPLHRVTSAPDIPAPRRHDLDALRAVAMLLGIALHAALAYAALPWIVSDPGKSNGFGILFYAVHGFRMPLFFVMSGFFTAMLWRRRGLRSLLWHRFRRVFCPLVLGLFTVVPLLNWVSGLAIRSAFTELAESVALAEEASDLWTAAQAGDIDVLRIRLADGTGMDALDARFGVTPLARAVLAGQAEATAFLIEQGANVNARHRDGATALHCAAVFGRTDLVRLLIERGADVDAQNFEGYTPLDSTQADIGTVRFIAALFEVELEEGMMRQGWIESAELLREHGGDVRPGGGSDGEGGKGAATGVWALLIGWPVFHHLWFLWHLCWLVAGFALMVTAARILPWPRAPAWLLLTPARFIWLIPLTMVPQAYMDGFGPDTSVGLLPMPHVLGYYAIFFGFGALYYTREDPQGRISRGWWLMIPIGLLIVFPLGLQATLAGELFGMRSPRILVQFLQASFPWLMTFGLMGLFRRLLNRERAAVRYISDSSYWLYLAHLPLVIVAQMWMRSWGAPAGVKFTLVCVGVSALLLASYEMLVRYTWLGALLNGRRRRPGRAG